MDSQRLRQLMKNDAGSIKAFALKHGLRYTTIYEATKQEEGLYADLFMVHEFGFPVPQLVHQLKHSGKISI